MSHIKLQTGRRRGAGFTLAEVLISIALLGMMLGGIITSYLAAAQRAEWASASAAAHRLVVMKMEQLKVAEWHELETSNWAATLDMPSSTDPEDEPIDRRPRVFLVVDREDEDFLKLTVWCEWHLGSRRFETPNPPLVTFRARD